MSGARRENVSTPGYKCPLLVFSSPCWTEAPNKHPRKTPPRPTLTISSSRSSDDEVQEMIDEADRDNDGQISAEEFLRVMKKRSGNPLDDWDSDDE